MELEGWPSHEEDAPQATKRDLEIVLRRPGAELGSVSGQVVDPDGRLVADARVALGPNLVKTDEQGAFTMKVPEGGTKASWTAVKRGYLPAVEPPSAAVEAGTADGSEFVLLKLGPPPPAIEGRVVDRRGEPLAGIKVWPAELTFFARIEEVPAQVEGLLAGAAGRPEVEKILRSIGPDANPQEVLMGTPTTFWPFVKTDDAGRFRLEGLREREYSLVAMDQETLLRSTSEPVRAGKKGVELLLDVDSVYPRVAGTVLVERRPVLGVTVAATRRSRRARAPAVSRRSTARESATTDAKGQFVLQRVPRERVYLRPTARASSRSSTVARTSRDQRSVARGGRDARAARAAPLPLPGRDRSGSEDGRRDHVDASGGPLAINLFMGNRGARRTAWNEGREVGRARRSGGRSTLVLLRGVEIRRVELHSAGGAQHGAA